jgi:trimeric autotransporter adhesin
MTTGYYRKSFIVRVALLLAMKTSSVRLAAGVITIAAALAICPTIASGTTVLVTVAPGGELSFAPSSVTIHPGDTVQWGWDDNDHSSTSGTPGSPNGLWDSGIRNRGASFSHTFNSAGSFPYYCTPHGQCCGMVGTVTVSNPTPTPTPTPTPRPAVTTNPATDVASFSATLNGSLNPHGSITSVHFQYGPTTSYGFTTPVQTQTGNTVRNISANIIGLSAGHIYHFRIVASNGGGTSFGSDRTFTTLSATGVPVVTTNPATNVASFSATLNGSLDPHGLTTTIHFQYGTTTSYGLTAAAQSQTGSTYRDISANISGLTASTTYHFRIVATNTAGTSAGSDRTFTTLSATGSPVVTTDPATLIASFSALLNGLLDPHGLTTSVHFQYGTTTSYGLTAAAPAQTGNTFRTVSASISGLSANRVYHFRIMAANSAGPSLGSDRTFTTLTATGPPVVTTSPATNVASSSATLNGSLDPHGLTTSVSFQYGTTTNYGHTSSMQNQTGSTFRNVSANISGLSAHTIYHFRIIATNSAGNRLGSDRTFTTL